MASELNELDEMAAQWGNSQITPLMSRAGRRRPTLPPATSGRLWTPDAFRARCLELAEATDAPWWARAVPIYAGDQQPGAAKGAVVAVSVYMARRARNASYDTHPPLYARYHVELDSATCEACAYGAKRQPCIHAGLAIIAGRSYLTSR